MRVLYVARHYQEGSSQDDEGAITHALRMLGHSVVLVDQESRPRDLNPQGGFDLLLAHRLPAGSGWWQWARGVCPLAVWYFDQVVSTDPSLMPRTVERQTWASWALRHSDFMFCTDGDFVHHNPKAILLRQGADERWWDVDEPADGPDLAGKVLVTAGVGRAAARKRFMFQLATLLGPRLVHHQRGLYGREFVRAVSTADLVVAPDSPSTHRYWSNRVYITLAAGGCLLHPHCESLAGEYVPGRHLMMYKPGAMVELLGGLLDPSSKRYRDELKDSAKKWTREHHLYRHRVEQLLKRVTNEACA